MGETEFKHVIALLLEDAKRLQELEPNAGTEARIWVAKEALASGVHEASSALKQTVDIPVDMITVLMYEDDPIKRKFLQLSALTLLSTEKGMAP